MLSRPLVSRLSRRGRQVAGRPLVVVIASTIFLLGFVPARAVAEFSIPTLSGPVVDSAGLLSAASKARLEGALQTLQAKGGTQLAVLTLPNLGGLTIEQASIQVTDEWKLGTQDADNGVLLIIAREERKVRIEVGQGLEGALPDAYAKRIIDESITPLFRTGDLDAGVTVGVFEIARRTNPELDLTPYLEGSLRAPARGARRERGSPMFFVLFMVVGLLLSALQNRTVGPGGSRVGRGGHYWLGGGGLGGGGSFGGGFGGGGFGGGGGGFSGGGASGGW